MNRRLAAVLGFLLFVGPAAPVAADSVAVPPPGGDGWEPLHFDRIPRHTFYVRERGEAGDWVRAESDCAASALVIPLPDLDLAATPVLRWRWRVDRPLQIRDERVREGDDFAARVYVMFRFEPEGSSLFQRLRHRIARAASDTEPPGSALSFVWTSGVAPGEVWPNPYVAESRMIAVAQGGFGVWREEAVDVPARYRSAFEREAPPVLALGLMTDSDDACQQASASFADFRFTSRNP